MVNLLPFDSHGRIITEDLLPRWTQQRRMPKKGIFGKVFDSFLCLFPGPISNPFPILSHSSRLAAVLPGLYLARGRRAAAVSSSAHARPCSQAGDGMSNLHITSSFQRPHLQKHLHTWVRRLGSLSFFSMRIKAFLSGNKGSDLKRETITTTNSRVKSLKKRVHLHCKHWGREKSCNKHRICRLSRSNTMAGKRPSVSVCQGECTRLNKNVTRIRPWNQPATSNDQAKPPLPAQNRQPRKWKWQLEFLGFDFAEDSCWCTHRITFS